MRPLRLTLTEFRLSCLDLGTGQPKLEDGTAFRQVQTYRSPSHISKMVLPTVNLGPPALDKIKNDPIMSMRAGTIAKVITKSHIVRVWSLLD